MLSRRQLLQLALAAPFAASAASQTLSTATAAPRRLAVLDWGLAELTLALGVVPAAVSAPSWYRSLIGQPMLPPQVTDIGLLFQPNIETLYDLRPDLIVITPGHAMLKNTLEEIAPTLTLPTGNLAACHSAAQQLANALQRQTQLQQLEQQLAQSLAQAQQLSAQNPIPWLMATPIDALHMRLYAAGNLFGDLLAACGMHNAWQQATNQQGVAQVEITRIGAMQARLLLLPDPQQQAAISQWQQSLLWQRLPLMAKNNTRQLPQSFSSSGSLVTANRLVQALITQLRETS